MIESKITCRGFRRTDSIQALVDYYLAKIEKISPRIFRCDVSIDLQHRHRKGQIFHVHIILKTPKKLIVINREPEKDHSHEELPIALRDAFRAAKRRIEDEIRIKRGFVKKHTNANSDLFVS